MTVINTNIGAVNAQSNMTQVAGEFEQAMTRLSSGKRINAAKDDAAGNAIAEKMTSQIRGLKQATRNATDGMNLVDTTEGAHEEVSNMLQRIRELAVQSANDTNTDEDRLNISAENEALINEINRIARDTTYNGMNIMDGTFVGKQFQIGADAGQTVAFNVASAAATEIGAYTARTNAYVKSGAQANAITNDSFDIIGAQGQQTVAVAAGDSAKEIAAKVNALTRNTGVTAKAETNAKLTLGAGTTSMELSIKNAGGTDVNVGTISINDVADLSDVVSRINTQSGETGVTAKFGDNKAEVILSDAVGNDINISLKTAGGAATFAALDSDEQAAASGSGTVSANTTAGTALDLNVSGQVTFASSTAFNLDQATPATDGTTVLEADLNSSLESVASIDLSNATSAGNAIRIVDSALERISTTRAELGALSNRLESTVSNLTNIATNVQAARSGIQDADFAEESTNLARGQILSQAATAMLAQANASQQNVLALLR